MLVPGARERHDHGRHELPSLSVIAANGYRIPLGAGALKETLRALRPDVVLLHDPFWWPVDVIECARENGARTVAVHHGTQQLGGRGAAGPVARLRAVVASLAAPLGPPRRCRDVQRRHDGGLRPPGHDAAAPRRARDVPPASRCAPRRPCAVCRSALREKGVLELLEAAARSADPWPLRIVGSGPLEETLRTRARKLGLAAHVSFRPYARDRVRLAHRYASARCVVMPGEHETFGLVALEAAACGTPVAACSTAPALHAIGALGHGFVPGDPDDLDRAIAAAREAVPDVQEAAMIGWRHGWQRVFCGRDRRAAGPGGLSRGSRRWWWRDHRRVVARRRARDLRALCADPRLARRPRHRPRHVAGHPRTGPASVPQPPGRTSPSGWMSVSRAGDAVAQHGFQHRQLQRWPWPAAG